MKMIWGDWINLLRQLHYAFWLKYPVEPKNISLFTPFHFPKATHTLGEWHPWEPQGLTAPSSHMEFLESHPVERILLEGPLLPLQFVQFKSPNDLMALIHQLYTLEQEWLTEVGYLKPEAQTELEHLFQLFQKVLVQKFYNPNLPLSFSEAL